MYEDIWFYHGKQYSYVEYFVVISVLGMLIASLILYLLTLLIFYIFRLTREDFEKYSKTVIERQKERRLIELAISSGIIRQSYNEDGSVAEDVTIFDKMIGEVDNLAMYDHEDREEMNMLKNVLSRQEFKYSEVKGKFEDEDELEKALRYVLLLYKTGI